MATNPNAQPSISLLIVEDCLLTSKSYATILSMQFPEVAVYTASNGTTGLELFKTHMPDIVITDYSMPDLDGRKMAVQIRAIKPESKLIVITGNQEELELLDILENTRTFDHVIVKPVDFQSFLAAITQCKDEIARYDSCPAGSAG